MKLHRGRHAEAPPPQTPPARPTAPRDLDVRPGGRRLGELIVAANLASHDVVVAALAEAQRAGDGKRLGRILLDRGTITDHDLAEILADSTPCRWSTSAPSRPTRPPSN